MGHHDCSGCGLCLLVCPVWRESRDVRLTPKGRAKAIQHGATRADIAASVAGCTLCGACEPACPEELPLVDMVMELRRGSALPSPEENTFVKNGKLLFLPGRALAADPERRRRTLALLPGHEVSPDGGEDVVVALESGGELAAARLEVFLAPLRGARRLVVAEGLLIRALRAWLPRAEVAGLGEALLPALQGKLKADDLYVIESRAFNGDHGRLLARYDALRAASGCHMNLDLQRIAVPAAGQGAWILEGRAVRRIIVEDLADRDAFSFAGHPVMHVAELA